MPALYTPSFDETLYSADPYVNDAINTILAGLAEPGYPDYYHALARHLAKGLNVPYAFVAKYLGPKLDRVRTLALWSGRKFEGNVEYALQDTPCANVVRGSAFCYYPRSVQIMFPRDLGLIRLSIESYIGAPVFDEMGMVIGHIALMDTATLSNEPQLRAVLEFFAARTTQEMLRHL